MSAVTVTPYLFFKGNCREAMEFYKGVFGGQLTMHTYADMPMPDTPESLKDQVMHAALTGGDVTLMASDTEQASPVAKKVSVSISGFAADREKLTGFFDRLSEDVTVTYPLKEEPWGSVFGSIIDKYGIEWMVDISLSEQPT